MIELENDQLVIRFPEVHPEAEARIEFQRTLRIPDDNQIYPLPPGLGRFPLCHVDDYRGVPEKWLRHGGVFMPLWQAEAAWMHFDSVYPMAIKVGAGKVNAVTGEPWENVLQAEPQDYLVIPRQPWLDGFCVRSGLVRQFVAAPLGAGDTVEEQLTGSARHGGVQIVVYPMKGEVYERSRQREVAASVCEEFKGVDSSSALELGLAPGGAMRQEIYEDEHGIGAWDTYTVSRCFVHLLNSTEYEAITGHLPPTRPPSANEYSKAGLPWFDYYDADVESLGGSAALGNVDSLARRHHKRGESFSENKSAVIGNTIQLGSERGVRDGGGFW